MDRKRRAALSAYGLNGSRLEPHIPELGVSPEEEASLAIINEALEAEVAVLNAKQDLERARAAYSAATERPKQDLERAKAAHRAATERRDRAKGNVPAGWERLYRDFAAELRDQVREALAERMERDDEGADR